MKSKILLAIGISLVLVLGVFSAFSSQHSQSPKVKAQQEMIVST